MIKEAKWLNDSGEECPAFGIFKVSDSDIGDDGHLRYTGDKPDGLGELWSVNKNVPVADAAEGARVTKLDETFPVLWDDSESDPSVGDSIGPQSGSFKASQDGTGFKVVHVPSGKDYVICEWETGVADECRDSWQIFIYGDIATSGTLVIDVTWDDGTGTETTDQVTLQYDDSESEIETAIETEITEVTDTFTVAGDMLHDIPLIRNNSRTGARIVHIRYNSDTLSSGTEAKIAPNEF